MAGVIYDDQVMFSVPLLHEAGHGAIEAILRAAPAPACFQARAFVRQIDDFGVISEFLSEQSFEVADLCLVRPGQ